MTFELLLTGEKVKPHQIIALHLMSAITIAGAGAVLYKKYPPGLAWGIGLIVGGLILMGISVFRSRWMTKGNNNTVFRIIELLTALSLAVLSVAKHWTPAIIMFSILSAALLFALILEKSQKNKLFVRVSEEGIQLPATARRRFLTWYDTEQVLLRYGTITIDCRENKLYQWTIADLQFDHREFEDFCRRQIEAGKTKGPKNDW